MKVEIFPRKIIKQSPPTPHDHQLKNFQISYVDKFSPLVYTPLLLFYPTSNVPQAKEAIEKLEASLSQTLRGFFFMELEEIAKTIFHCTYEEVIFVEARIGCNMSDILKERSNDAVLMELLMYSTLCTDPDEKYAQVAVQANIFNCGGVAISLCLLHELMDATTLSCFLRSWVCINTKSFNSFPSIVCSDFGPLSSLFDPRQRERNPKCTYSSQRFVFKDEAIQRLKDEAKSRDVQDPACVEVLTGFIWKCALEIVGPQRPSILSHAVNLQNGVKSSRPKLFSVGKFWWATVARCFASEAQVVKLSELVRLLRESFEEMNGDYVQSLVGDEEGRDRLAIVELLEERDRVRSGIMIPKLYVCTSCENMDYDLKEVDFKWGNAIWIDNIAILLRTVPGDGVGVWIVIDKEEIDLLVPKLLEVALLDLTIP